MRADDGTESACSHRSPHGSRLSAFFTVTLSPEHCVALPSAPADFFLCLPAGSFSPPQGCKSKNCYSNGIKVCILVTTSNVFHSISEKQIALCRYFAKGATLWPFIAVLVGQPTTSQGLEIHSVNRLLLEHA